MCSPTAIAVSGLLLSAASTAVGMASESAALDRQYADAKRRKAAADAASSAQLRADRDKAARQADNVQEKSLREQVEIRKTQIKDVGAAQAQATATGTSGISVDNLVADLYRDEANQLDASERNQKTQLSNLANEVASAETSHRYQLASGAPTRGAGTSAIAAGLDIGTSAVGAYTQYKQLSSID